MALGYRLYFAKRRNTMVILLCGSDKRTQVSDIKRAANWDNAGVLTTPERIAVYLEVALKDGNAGMLKVALGSIARSKGVAEIAEKADVSRQALYRALSPEGDPNLSTLICVIKALGIRLHVVPA